MLFCAAAATLEDIEKTRAAFSDDTTRLKEELAVQSAEKDQLSAHESELQSCQREKGEDLCALTRKHEQERERNQQSLEQVRGSSLFPLLTAKLLLEVSGRHLLTCIHTDRNRCDVRCIGTRGAPRDKQQTCSWSCRGIAAERSRCVDRPAVGRGQNSTAGSTAVKRGPQRAG